MLIESIVRFTLKIKDYRVVSTRLTNNELRIELNVKKGRKLPCSICGERCRQKDKLVQRCYAGLATVSLWGIAVFLF